MSVKGNSKGWSRSFRLVRIMYMGGVVVLLTLVFVTVVSFFPARQNNNKVSSVFAHAAEMEVTAQGDMVGSQASSLKKETKPITLNHFPTLKYGTAWKKDNTDRHVHDAVMAGFRHIDTACQPRHYSEGLVGKGWTEAAQELHLDRSDLWIQTKFTSQNGQDMASIPYDPKDSLENQVKTSLKVSLENLQTSYLNSWLMHGPEDSWEANLEVWRTMESFVESDVVKQIGISNFYDVDAIEYLYNQATVKPAVVQNRFYSDSGYDVDIREFCAHHGIEYQSFWTLGANYHALHHTDWIKLADSKNLTPETLMYAFCMSIGISPLDGTTNLGHMKQDIDLLKQFQSSEEFLTAEEVELCSDMLEIPEPGHEEEDWDEEEEEEWEEEH